MPARRAASADPTLDLSHLTDAEKRQLVQVLQRDGELQDAERQRITKMKSFVRQEDRSADALLQRGDFNERYCIRCYRRFLLLFNPWVCCCLCSLRVCKGRCAQRNREFNGSFVCGVCDRSRLCLAGQCQWFYDAVKKKFRNSGSSKVTLSLSRDAQQFAEACQSASSQPSLAIEQMFTAPAAAARQGSLDSNGAGHNSSRQFNQQLADSGHGGSLSRRGLYRTELTFATAMKDELDGSAAVAAAAAGIAEAVEESAASTVGLQVTVFQSQLHDVLRRLQAELRARVSDEREASVGEGKEVADRFGREIADLISTFAQTLHATLASRDGSPCSVEARLQRVQRVVQQEVENAIGLSVDRVVHHAGSACDASSAVAAAAAAAVVAAAAGSEDGEDSGLELEGRLADFVVQKVLDDHLVMLEEEAAAEAAAVARRSSPVPGELPEHFFGYRQLPSSIPQGGRLAVTARFPHSHDASQRPASSERPAPAAAGVGGFRLQNDFGLSAAFATSSGRTRVPEPASGSLAAAADITDAAGEQHLDQHIDSLFAFKSNSSFQGHNQESSQQQVSSTPKSHRQDAAAQRRRLSDRLATQPPPPPPRSDLRLGRFASRIMHNSCSDSDDDSGDSWDREPPVLAAVDSPLLLRFGRIDWDQNERTNPRFCAKPEAVVVAPRGERVTFRAVVDGTEPIEVLWHRLKSGRAYEICDSDKYELTSDSAGDSSHCLTVYHAADADAGAYLVIATNSSHTVLHGFKLRVVDNALQSKAPAFTEPMSDTRAREGRTARFRCRVSGQPAPRVTFLRDGAAIRPDGGKYHVVNIDNSSYELQINDVTKSDDAEYSCLATNSAGSTQCDCQLLVYRLAEEDEALKRIEGEIQQTQASMINAAKDMYRASGKIRQLDANFGRLNQRLSSMEKQLVHTYPESSAIQRITGHMVQRLADHQAASGSAVEPDSTESSFEAPVVSDWSLTSGGVGGEDSSAGLSSFESVPQVSASSKIVYEIENVVDGEASDCGESGEEQKNLAVTERRIYVAASKNSLLRLKLDELEQQISGEDVAALDTGAMEKALANLQLLAAQNDAEVDGIEVSANQLGDKKN